MIKINNKLVTLNRFPDNTLLIKENINDSDNSSVYGIDITWLYEGDEELFALQCIVDKIRNVFENPSIYLYLPYIPNARMDRVKNEEDFFTLKTFCNIINSMNLTNIIVADAHSDVSLALLNNVREMRGISACLLWQGNNKAVFYPDAGAHKRYKNAYPTVPNTYGNKTRNWETGRIENLVIAEPEVVKNKDVLIVDDICSYGGTFVRAAAALKEAGARSVSLAVTHCEKNIFKGKIFTEGNIDFVYTTNSILSTDNIPEEYKEKVKIYEIW